MTQETIILKEAVHEMDSWKKTLLLLQQENSVQKNRLVDILKGTGPRTQDLLEVAEGYQNRFLQQDEAFTLMWKDLARLENSVAEKSSPEDITCWQKKLRGEIKTLDANFDELKRNFNRFLEVHIADNDFWRKP